jgi:hypothetical protein
LLLRGCRSDAPGCRNRANSQSRSVPETDKRHHTSVRNPRPTLNGQALQAPMSGRAVAAIRGHRQYLRSTRVPLHPVWPRLVARSSGLTGSDSLLCALAFVWTALWHERRTRFSALDVALEGRADSLIGAVRDAEDLADTIKVNPAEFSPSSTDVYAVYSQEANWWGLHRTGQLRSSRQSQWLQKHSW